MATPVDWASLAFKCSKVFSPSAPVSARDLFAGRIPQISRVSEAVNIKGRHAIIYGDRGVGKTSLANILKHILVEDLVKVVKVTCASSDTFVSVWAKAMDDMYYIQEESPAPAEIKVPHHHEQYRLSQFMSQYAIIGPSEIGRLLLKICHEDESQYVIIFDEYDRLPAEHRKMFADTIKGISDNAVNATVVLVGVAQDVNELVAEHQSIERNLTQVPLPPMNNDELGIILETSMDKLGMSMDKKASNLIVSLSYGYPHYTHVLGMESTRNAIFQKRLAIKPEDTAAALKECIAKTEQSVRDDYYKASEGQRKGSLYPLVLLACALTKPDQMGYFRSIEVQGPLSKVLDKECLLSTFGTHLEKFSSDESRGPILERRGTSRLYRYKFKNPILRPYIIMRGIQEGVITGTFLERITNLQPEKNSTLFGGDETSN